MEQKRIYAYDFMRAVAIIMVVAVHCIPMPADTAGAHIYTSFMQALLFPCNAVFFILSGLLNLKEKSLSNVSGYTYRKFRGILLPTLVFMFVNTIYDMARMGTSSAAGPFASFAVNAFSAYANGIFWFVMAIFGMLLVAPFFARSFEHMDSKAAKAFFAAFLTFSGLNLIGVLSGTGFGWAWPMAGFFTIFLLGPAIGRIRVSHAAIPFAVFAACVAVSTLLILVGVPHHPVNDNTPFYFVAGVSLFLGLLKAGESCKPNRAISLISKYSFDIYMCHLMVLPFMPDFLGSMIRPLAHLVTTALVLAISLAISVALDAVAVKPLQKLLNHAHSRFAAGHQADGTRA